MKEKGARDGAVFAYPGWGKNIFFAGEGDMVFVTIHGPMDNIDIYE
jgi:hypothetical protein